MFGRAAMGLFRTMGIPEYLRPRSNHVFSFWQKLALAAFMAEEGLSYHSLCAQLGKYRGFMEAVGLTYIPDGSTMCKFVSRLDTSLIESLFGPFSGISGKGCVLAMDATGLSNFRRSAHYEKRCVDFGKSPRRTFTKLSLVVDTVKRFVLSARASCSNRADVSFSMEHVADLEAFGTSPSMIVADKGYDSDTLHRTIRNSLGCEARIPVRKSRGKRGYVVHGVFRRNMLALMEDEDTWRKDYGRRAVVESCNFMIKFTTGDHIDENIPRSRENKALLKAFSFNISNSIRLGCDWRLSV